METVLLVLIGLIYAWVGLSLGSFSNVVIYRIPRHLRLDEPKRSFCPNCHHQIAWYDNIPLLSFLVLGGRCRYCHKPISWRYPLVETLGLLSFVIPFLAYDFGYPVYVFSFSFDYRSVVVPFIFLLLVNMAFIDFDTQEVPLWLSVPYTALCGGSYVADAILNRSWLPDRMVAFLVILLFLFALWAFYYFFRHKDGLGWGDIMLMAASALFVGAFGILGMVLIACLAFFAYYGIRYHEAKKVHREGELRDMPFPFVPFLAIGAIPAFLFGQIASYYLLGL